MATGSAGCVNLKERFGDRYKVTYEESYYAERSRHTVVDPWLMIIPCKYGHIFPWGGELLAASVDGHPNIAGVVRRLACTTVRQQGDFGELTASFHVDDFDQLAKIMVPRRRRQVSETERNRLAEVGRRFRFQHGYECEHSDLERTQTTPDDSEHQTAPTA